MSLTHSTPTLAASPFRLVALYALNSSQRRCPQCFRTFSSARAFRASARRELQTASALHPTHLEPPPPPPRNVFAPGTRITKDTGSRADAEAIAANGGAAEQEQQQQQQTTAATQPSEQQQQPQQQQKMSPPRHFKFAPRKAAIKLTPAAVQHVRQLLDQPEPKLLRIGTKNRGCSGLAYHLEYVDRPGKFDETIEQDGVKVLIESRTLLHIIGSEMDWVEDKLSARFVFRNPNITEQCGCGESFSVS